MVNDRQNKQLELTARSQGYEPDGEGGYKPTQVTQQTQQLQETQLQANLDAANAQLAQLKSQTSADSITQAIESVIEGDWHNTRLHVGRVKGDLRKAKSLDFTEMNPVNFGDPKDLAQLNKLGVNTDILRDSPEVQDALNRSFVKITGHNGETRIQPVDSIMKATNTWNMMNTQQRDRYTTNARNINAILKGAGITSQQEKLQGQAEQLKIGEQERALKYQSEMQAAIESGDMQQIQAIQAKYNAQTPTEASKSALEYAKANYYSNPNISEKDKGAASKLIETYDKEHPNATKEERIAFVDKVMKKSVEGVSSVKEQEEVYDLNALQAKAKKFAVEYDDTAARETENNILRTLDKTRKASVEKDRTVMEGNFNTFSSIDRIIGEFTKGQFQVDKDAIANTKTYLSKIFGNDVPQELLNANFNTASGMILAQFMKDVSGTAVGVKEAERLSNIFQGGDLADEQFVLNAMRKFSSELKEKNKVLGETNQQYIPQSVNRFSPPVAKASAADF